MHNNTGFGAYLYSVGTQHGNLYQSSVTTSRVTYFILQADTGTALATANTGKSRERFWKKNEGEWTGKVEISKEKIPGSW